MPRRVFFSFHYGRDAWNVSQIRNSSVVKASYEKTRFLDHADWEEIMRKGDANIKRWINEQLHGASVTVVLIGAETYSRKWVQYEIEESHRQGMGILGVRLYGMKDNHQKIDNVWGKDPFEHCKIPTRGFLGFETNAQYPIYSWTQDNGRENLGHWIEKAARDAGR